MGVSLYAFIPPFVFIIFYYYLLMYFHPSSPLYDSSPLLLLFSSFILLLTPSSSSSHLSNSRFLSLYFFFSPVALLPSNLYTIIIPVLPRSPFFPQSSYLTSPHLGLTHTPVFSLTFLLCLLSPVSHSYPHLPVPRPHTIVSFLFIFFVHFPAVPYFPFKNSYPPSSLPPHSLLPFCVPLSLSLSLFPVLPSLLS